MTRRMLSLLTAGALVLAVLSASEAPAPAKEAAKAPAAKKPAPAKPTVAALGKPAPPFALADENGKKVSLSGYAGKVVVLEWINPGCPFSRRHYTTPTMKTLATKYAGKGVVWLTINSTKTSNAAKNKNWVTRNKLPYPILDDSAGDVGRLYDAKTTPDMRIIDAKGKLVYSGAIDDDPRGKKASPVNHVAAALEEILAGKKVSTPKTKPYGCSVKYAPAAPPAPPFALTDQNGKKVSLADYAGKIVVLEWVNPDCPFSKRQYTNGTVKGLATKYAPKGVVWLAINTTHYWTNEKNKAWVEQNDLPYPILNDQSGAVGRAYGAKTTPDMRIIDAAGKVVYSGAINDDPRGKKEKPVNHVAAALDELLAGKKVSTAKTKPYGCSVKYAKVLRK